MASEDDKRGPGGSLCRGRLLIGEEVTYGVDYADAPSFTIFDMSGLEMEERVAPDGSKSMRVVRWRGRGMTAAEAADAAGRTLEGFGLGREQ
jgi:hypothetical protein